VTSVEIGVQFHLPSHRALPLPEILELAEMAVGGGVSQLWVTDNLQNRNVFVTLAAIASRVPVKLGAAIMVQYFRNPVDAAGALATVTELMDPSSELCIGIGRGNIRTSRFLETPMPVSMMRETAQCLRALFDGDAVDAAGYPTLASYFNYAPEAVFQMNVTPRAPVHIYCGGDGPKSLALGGEFMDGLLCGTTFYPLTKMGFLAPLLEVFDAAARGAGKTGPPRRVAEIKVALSRDANVSREFARRGVGSRVLGLRWRGYTSAQIAPLGITAEDIDRLEEAARTTGGTSEELAPLVTDAMIDAYYVAGDLDYCRERIRDVGDMARSNGFHQVLLSGISSDFRDGIRLLCDEIMPGL
jgi:alkanesulfonate monooxygenase SsuD/methylene tetrahydromethanopterin reductase-like flavin-dependent oxidoreductase (luciferase family)